MSLTDLIRRMIAVDGPMPLDRYWALALNHPEYGFYMKGRPIGAQGAFTTAPEISQMFGELLGVWTVLVWRQLGCPSRIDLVEIGPGRGVMMADVLRVACRDQGFRAAVRIALCEVSSVLRAEQQNRLAAWGPQLTWIDALQDLRAAAPVILLANEVFDALPVRQAVKGAQGWRERLIGWEGTGFAWGLSREPLSPALLPPSLVDAAPGTILEFSPARAALARQIAARVASASGAALIVDYGYQASKLGETLQALRAHQATDPLLAPGDADITAHVDFGALAQAAETSCDIYGPIGQGEFLRAMGIAERAATLRATATPQQASDINAALHRLTDATEMGELFKVMALVPKHASRPPGI